MSRKIEQQLKKQNAELKSQLEGKEHEIKIEASLERVRSVTMEMHHTNELNKIISIVFKELTKLDFELTRVAIWIFDRHTDSAKVWIANPELPATTKNFHLPYSKHPQYLGILKAWKKKVSHWEYLMIGKEKSAWEKFLFSKTDFADFIPNEIKKAIQASTHYTFHASLHEFGCLHTTSPEPLSQEKLDIFHRFGKMFDQAFKRFLDLQKAEVQAREAQIEVSLERVRTSSMAMHKSEELVHVVRLLNKEIKELGIQHVDATHIITEFSDTKKGLNSWVAVEVMNYLEKFHMPYSEIYVNNPVSSRWYRAIRNKENFYTEKYSKAEKNRYLRLVFKYTDFKRIPKERQIALLAAPGFERSIVINKNSSLIFQHYGLNEFTEEDNAIFKRFGKVFEQTYTRFLDLQKAESQAKEAQIEAALERVRSKTMTIQRSEELDVVIKMVYAELKQLDILFSLCFIMIFDERKGATWWMGSPDGNLFHEGFYVPYHKHPPYLAYLKGWKERQKKWEYLLAGKIKKDWDEFIFSKTELSRLPPMIIQTMKSFDAANLAATFENFGCMTIGGPERLSDESFDILNRFAKVFDQAYTRFKDLKNAEAQAREAQIEAALERVRATSMAMHRSDELVEVVRTLDKEIIGLGIEVNGSQILTDFENKKEGLNSWYARDGQKFLEKFHVPYSDRPQQKKFWDERKKGIKFYTEKYSKAEKDRFFRWLYRNSDFGKLPKERQEFVYKAPGWVRATVHFRNSVMIFQRLNLTEFTKEEEDIFKRFGKVFEQSYTRFLDLKKAEAHAREAQIEVALERVRAASMAMHKSQELQEVIKVVCEQFLELGIKLDSTLFVQVLDGGSWDVWNTTPTQTYPAQLHIPFIKTPPMSLVNQAYAQGKKEISLVFSKKGKDAFLKYFFTKTNARNIPDARKKYVLNSPGWALSFFFMKNIILAITTLSGIPFSVEENAIFRRFKNVFEQAYTRFLDLQKAEAQAREAQIEVALERVRAKAMAMHTSNDLKGVALELRRQMGSLGQKELETCAIHLYEGSDEYFTSWAALKSPNSGSDIILTEVQLPKKGVRSLEKIIDHYNKGKEDYLIANDRKNFQQFSQALKVHAPEALKVVQKTVRNRKQNEIQSYWSVSDFKGGSLLMSTTSLPGEDSRVLLRRFANVFDLAYRRFSDLKKAEAQAREAEIQLALERVRSTAMAMHSSNELSHTIKVLFDQLHILGINPINTYLVLYDLPNNRFSFRMTGKRGSELTEMLTFSFDKLPGFKPALKAWQSGAPVIEAEYLGDDRKKWLDLIRPMNAKLSKGNKLRLSDFPNGVYSCSGRHEFGSLGILKEKKASDKEKNLLVRFAKEFNQTYTRFLDLQKAEAQAREAEIQLALERVRARTIAMQKSDELREVVGEFFRQVQSLGIEIQMFVIFIFKPDGSMEWWGTEFGEKGLPQSYVIPPLTEFTSHSRARNLIEIKKKKTRYQVFELSGVEKKNWDQFLLNKTDLKQLPAHIKKGMRLLDKIVLCDSVCDHGILEVAGQEALSNEHANILQRFTKVFEQTYTRFLDVQKAEAQAREAKIEAALERVRAAGMAMHKSEDLAEASTILFEQLVELGIEARRVGFALPDDKKQEFTVWSTIRGDDGKAGLLSAFFYYDQHPIYLKMIEHWHAGIKLFSCELHGSDVQDYYKSWNRTFKTPKALLHSVKENTSEYYQFAYFKQGIIYAFTAQALTETQNQLLLRFAKAFELTYTRFLDLQKAEGQAREAEIQLALERVRARTMAMHKSEELAEVAAVLFQQLNVLGNSPERINIGIVREEKGIIEYWATEQDGKQINHSFNATIEESTTIAKVYAGWKENKRSMVVDLTGDELKAWMRYLLKELNMPFKAELIRKRRVHTAAFFSHGMLLISTHEPVPQETIDLLERFAEVFNLTYRRFLDLQKAEAQAKEAQIEAALERVRSRSVAMHRSEEIADIAGKIFSELRQLDLALNRVLIWTFNDAEKYTKWWSANPEVESTAESYRIDYNENPVFLNYLQAWQQRKPIHLFTLSGDTKKTWEDHLFEHTEMSRLPMAVRKGMRKEGTLYTVSVISDYGLMMSGSFEPLSDANIDIIQRFGRVFQQSYTRYLDVQKAEIQAREAQIEAALERVRAQTMAMHVSTDLQKIIKIVREQLEELDITLDSANFDLVSSESKDLNLWISSKNIPYSDLITIPYIKSKLFDNYRKARKEGKKTFSDVLTKKEKDEFFKHCFDYTDLGKIPEDRKALIMASNEFNRCSAQLKKIALTINNYRGIAYTEDDEQILYRFGQVFEQGYQRFRDLELAEAQTREAKIEASLERVRSKAMAMHNSADLSSAASVVFTELRKLGINPIRSGVGLFNKDSRRTQLYSAISSESGDSLSLVGWAHLEKHPVLEKIYETWLQQEDYFPELEGEQLRVYYQLLLRGLSVPIPDFKKDQKQFGYFFPFSIGCLYAWSDEHFGEEQIKIFKRFASIIDLTFRRYLELQKAEANAKEAIKQAALDRIRADIASMRTVGDLDRITPLIWNELTILGIPFIRCGVFIMDESQKLIHTFLSTPDGKAIAAFHLPYDHMGKTKLILENWQKRLTYIDHWNDSDFFDLAQTLVEQKIIQSSEQYLSTIPHGGLYLHCFPFLQGMLYVGNTIQLGDEEADLIQSVADAFSTAYARYEDFNKLEAAKQQVDKTLNDLKQTQQQLVQSEKMASLGELTAGIAHEIQNPLNFVNNFSEVNKEMIAEMKQEIDKGNFEEVKLIAKDIEANEEKINHHGKRADAIVKGMLQHSRSSSGVKEPTDINALCDEYLRLSYHGLRAKDKTFNAKFDTDFDASIDKINIVPQEMGRVILNLINNSFYAVTEKAKQSFDGYKPEVTISSRKIEGKIEIAVKDNGNGIPDAVKEKIFQPFFTTKPTGQGTGLGLSLSYDIVKAHGGELKVETEAGKGSEFIIQIPIN